MTQLLQSLLDAKEPIFSQGLIQLEKATGNSGVDTRLIADITEKAHDIMRRLGLDVRDTTGKELYHSLIAAVRCGACEPLLSDADYVLFRADDMIISFNMIDVIENTHHELPYDKQIYSHGQRSLRGELVTRYINHARTNENTTLEIASSIGLLPESDAWYNDVKYSKKQTTQPQKEDEI
jgi:hypothetical protein